MPWLNIALELYLAHIKYDGYKRLICPEGTARAGHIHGNNIGSWQHAYMYPGFIVSGLVDLVHVFVELPRGLPNIFLMMGMATPTLMMFVHNEFHPPIDEMIHSYLFYALFATCSCIAAEALWPSNPLLTTGRIAGTYLQGAWFIAAARLLYERKSLGVGRHIDF